MLRWVKLIFFSFSLAHVCLILILLIVISSLATLSGASNFIDVRGFQILILGAFQKVDNSKLKMEMIALVKKIALALYIR
ncbi:hypothetical protein RJT34_28514 [Clitoria ternatea]|uniref:Uncharacterized protein n=1 Tax=Clitoria ternatea TaxID=43366 RepID=A0AAN9ICL5_CLITE